ncbi:unnamed protein product [Soboliphyme baturini]|uniref:DOMON domain-containing protein n=1 Tax=Soboliphyme baturini TaxID=241478 RepID=A0A183JAG5_9BILA|nr:unnamed protein product [Soboliphyme baturini]
MVSETRRKREVSAESTKIKSKMTELPVLDCADILIGSAFDHWGKVEDYFAFPGSLPETDNNFRGHQSMTGAIAYSENGVTTMVVRRKLMATELVDSSITDEPMILFWLKGPLNTTENVTPQWGALTVNFFEQKHESSKKLCRNEFVVPKRCSAEMCKYNMTWIRHENNVQFILDVPLQPNQWTGVGFSKTGEMPGSDAVIVVLKDDGRIEVTDQFLAGRTSPVVDRIQNIFNIYSQYSNGRVTASFFRSLKTDDVSQDLDLTNCVYLLYPEKGGPLDLMGDPKMHYSLPLHSEKPVCFNECRTDLPIKKPSHKVTAERIQKPFSSYLMTFRILNRNLTERALGQSLHEEIENAVDSVMKQKLSGYSEAKISKLW